MNEQYVSYKETPNSKSYNVRLWTSITPNCTVLMSDSIAKKLINNKFDVISISGGRVETLNAFLTDNSYYTNYDKIVLLIGGNNLSAWKNFPEESPTTVIVLIIFEQTTFSSKYVLISDIVLLFEMKFPFGCKISTYFHVKVVIVFCFRFSIEYNIS